MRIAGLATGMDINQIVADLMKAQRMPIDKMMQDRQLLEWKMEDYREINRKIDTFRNNTFDSVIRQANMLAKTVSSTNESRVSATATANAGNMTLRISNVTELATAASYSSTAKISGATKIKSTGSLGSQEFGTGITWSKGIVHRENVRQSATSEIVQLGQKDITSHQDMVVKVNGKVYDVVLADATNTIDTITDDQVLLNAAGGTLTFKSPINQGTTVQTVYATKNAVQDFEVETARKTFQVQKGGLDLKSLAIKAGAKTYSVAEKNLVIDRDQLAAGKAFVNLDTGQIEFFEDQSNVSVDYQQRYTATGLSAYNAEGKEVSDKFIFTANQSLNTVFTEISRSSVGVNGFYDESADKINISRTATGLFNPTAGGSEVTFTGQLFESVLKMDGTGDGGAKNATFTLNGLQTTRQSNTFTVAGMTVTLKEKTVGAEVITLSASTDTDKVFETIKGFIDEYNELLDFVNGKVSEERHRDYRPLTDEQKDALSEKEVERWEERARSGMLRNDQALRSPFDRMRVDMYSSVSGALDTEFRQLSTVGITTSADYMERGKLVINEDKLRAAIESDAEGVFQLFAADGASFEEKGIARRVRDTLDGAINSLADRAGGFRGKVQNNQFMLGRSLDDINDRISNFERRLQQVEERYWRQFNAMDAAVNRANQQAETLFSQLMGNQG